MWHLGTVQRMLLEGCATANSDSLAVGFRSWGRILENRTLTPCFVFFFTIWFFLPCTRILFKIENKRYFTCSISVSLGLASSSSSLCGRLRCLHFPPVPRACFFPHLSFSAAIPHHRGHAAEFCLSSSRPRRNTVSKRGLVLRNSLLCSHNTFKPQATHPHTLKQKGRDQESGSGLLGVEMCPTSASLTMIRPLLIISSVCLLSQPWRPANRCLRPKWQLWDIHAYLLPYQGISD